MDGLHNIIQVHIYRSNTTLTGEVTSPAATIIALVYNFGLAFSFFIKLIFDCGIFGVQWNLKLVMWR